MRIRIEGGKYNDQELSKLQDESLREIIKKKIETKRNLFSNVSFEVEIDEKYNDVIFILPEITSLIKQICGTKKGSGAPGKEFIAELDLDTLIKIAIFSKEKLRTKTLKKAVKTVLGICRSMGVKVEGKDPKILQSEIEEGLYDSKLKEWEGRWDES